MSAIVAGSVGEAVRRELGRESTLELERDGFGLSGTVGSPWAYRFDPGELLDKGMFGLLLLEKTGRP